MERNSNYSTVELDWHHSQLMAEMITGFNLRKRQSFSDIVFF